MNKVCMEPPIQVTASITLASWLPESSGYYTLLHIRCIQTIAVKWCLMVCCVMKNKHAQITIIRVNCSCIISSVCTIKLVLCYQLGRGSVDAMPCSNNCLNLAQICRLFMEERTSQALEKSHVGYLLWSTAHSKCTKSLKPWKIWSP